jgi:hypothetical protein
VDQDTNRQSPPHAFFNQALLDQYLNISLGERDSLNRLDGNRKSIVRVSTRKRNDGKDPNLG